MRRPSPPTRPEPPARGREDVDGAPGAADAHRDRRERLDRGLVGAAAVRAGAVVEDEHGLGLPRRLVLAHDELAEARGRAPVDAAQVVADLVVAQREELVVRGRRHRHQRAPLRARPSLAGRGGGARQRVHARPHDHVVGAADLDEAVGEAERVGDPHDRGPDGEPAAAVGRDPVRGPGGLAALERRGDEACRPAAVVERGR